MYELGSMGQRRTISTARRQLFDLFDQVTATDGEKIIIVRRNVPKAAVLVSRDYLEQLETTTRQLTRGGAEAFSLFGSAALSGSPDDVLRATRREQTRLGARKRDSLSPRRRA